MIPSITSRRSVRRYEKRPLPRSVIEDILACARLAPSAHNRQPWLIGAIDDSELVAAIADVAPNGRFIQQSAVCFAVFCRADEKYYLEDGCAATMNIIHGAHAHDVGTCWVAGDKKEYADAVRRLLQVPTAYTLVSLIAAGYPAQVPQPPKKSPEETIFWNTCAARDGSGAAQPSRREGRSPATRLKRAVRDFLLRRF